MSGATPSSGLDASLWLAANAALAERLSERRHRGAGLGSMLSGLAGRGITGELDEERTRRLKPIGARGSKAFGAESGARPGFFATTGSGASLPGGNALADSSRVNSTASSTALLARGYQPAVVKVISYAHGVTRATASAQYVERDEVQLETHEGRRLSDKEAVAEEIRAWSSGFEKRSPSQDVVSVRVQLSGLSDTSEDRALLRQAVAAGFEGHRHAVRIDVQRDGVLEARVVAVMARQITPEERAQGNLGGDKSVDVTSRPALPPRLRVVEQRMGTGNEAPMRKVFDARSEASMKARVVEKTGYPTHGISIEPGAPGHGREAVGQRLATLVSKAPALEHLGKPLRTADDIREVSRDWVRHLRSQTPRDTMHMVVSAKAGTDVRAFTHAVRAFLHDQFSNHKFMFGVHTDKLAAGHIHAHAIVAVRAENGAKLHPGPSDLAQWRVNYAAHARAHGLEVVATRATEQASSRSYGPKDKSIVDAATSPRPERKEQDRAYASDPRNADLINGAMKRMATARSNPVRIPQTERERAGVKQSLDHWQSEVKADPASAVARNMVERLSAAHAAGSVLHDLRVATGAAAHKAKGQGETRMPCPYPVPETVASAKNATEQEEHLLLLNKQVNEASTLLPAGSRAKFLEQTEAHLNTLAARLDDRREREAVMRPDVEGEAGGIVTDEERSLEIRNVHLNLAIQKTITLNTWPEVITVDLSDNAGRTNSASFTIAPAEEIANIKRRQVQLMQQSECARWTQKEKEAEHE